jgi:hypothetical protein
MRDIGFSDDELRTLVAVLDEIIPAGEGGAAASLPGAGILVDGGDLGVTLRAMPGLEPAIRAGLAAVATAAAARPAGASGGGFAALPREERLAVLDEVGAADPGFVSSATFLAYATYYRDRRVLEAIGFEPRPPHPKGYEMAPCDVSLTEPVRRRGRMYREC